MIQADPADPSNYFRLARLYEDAGVYDEAERIFLAARDNRPNDASVYTSLASYYNRQGRFDKTIAALEQRAAKDEKNPEAWQTIAVTTRRRRGIHACGMPRRRSRAEGHHRRRQGVVDRLITRRDDHKGLLLRLRRTSKGPGQTAAAAQGSNEPR
jgi:tetratricopeptide (TPR) repeat protein